MQKNAQTTAQLHSSHTLVILKILQARLQCTVGGCTIVYEEYAHIANMFSGMGKDLLRRPNKEGNTHTEEL